MMVFAFLAALFANSVTTLIFKKHTLLVAGLLLSCAILVMTIMCDWLFFIEDLLDLWANQNMTVFGVQLSIFLVGLLFAICAYNVHRKKPFRQLHMTYSNAGV